MFLNIKKTYKEGLGKFWLKKGECHHRETTVVTTVTGASDGLWSRLFSTSYIHKKMPRLVRPRRSRSPVGGHTCFLQPWILLVKLDRQEREIWWSVVGILDWLVELVTPMYVNYVLLPIYRNNVNSLKTSLIKNVSITFQLQSEIQHSTTAHLSLNCIYIKKILK